MKASVGDLIVIKSRHLDEPPREGEVVEVHGAGGDPPYVVRWDDGHAALLFPGPDARITHLGAPTAPRRTVHAKQWQITVSLVEYDDGVTKAHVVGYGGPRPLQTHGEAHRLPEDADVPDIGEEVAAGRALTALGRDLLGNASADIEEIEGHPASVGTSPQVRPADA